MLTPAYGSAIAVVHPHIYEAVADYIVRYGLPSLEPTAICRAGDESGLAPGLIDYAVITPLASVRHGTSTETMPGTQAADHEPERYEIRAYYETTMRLDLYSDSDRAWQRAYSLEGAFRTTVGVSFFRPYGLVPLYADECQELPPAEQASQNLRRYSLVLHLGGWAGLDVESAWFNSVTLERVEDVDVHHPPA